MNVELEIIDLDERLCLNECSIKNINESGSFAYKWLFTLSVLFVILTVAIVLLAVQVLK